MDRGNALAGLAGLLADPTRAQICLALLGGRAWTAGELARHTGVAASTTSAHLDRLREGGLVREQRQGRHRYVRLAGAEVAELLEDLTARLGPVPDRPRSLRAARASRALAEARTCYDHLAGRLGVEITDAMTARGLLDQDGGCALTEAGREWLTGPLGVEPSALHGRRAVARACVDWTERRPHLAGAAGAALREAFERRGWIWHRGDREVRVTADGCAALAAELGIRWG